MGKIGKSDGSKKNPKEIPPAERPHQRTDCFGEKSDLPFSRQKLSSPS